ncbi:SgcJ/EcaC family oxidoreductase [Fulvivirga sp. M361]|uniref:SgcJ/EcaC family oxidoreductase n=1 Tax=Fulvivirga sp. M361 TaxID=2594266 RepID=UPI001179DBED|nr:SgcJ/EcaC family oxidoreductase [Fulvivirga sp. M361]TRX62087.1 SgcJ/EcaC family oxidoreductase [Fulvivirga sp. M361]
MIGKPEGLPEMFIDFWNKRDANGIASLFIENADFINVVGLWWNNRGDIRKAHAYGLKTIFPDSHLSLIRTKVRRVSDDVAIVHAKMKLAGQNSIESTRHVGVRFNLFTFVVKRKKSKWICLAAHNTDIVPGKETNLMINNKIEAVNYRDQV